MIRRPPRSTRPDTLFPYTTLFRSLLHRAHGETDRHMRLVRGSHIVVPRLFDHGFAYFFQLPAGRIFFALPYEREFTLLGTTERDHGGSFDKIGRASWRDSVCQYESLSGVEGYLKKQKTQL